GGIAAQQSISEWAVGTMRGGGLTQSAGSYTPLYASPQQRRFGPPDPRDDVYALGVIWYQMLAGDVTREPPRGGGWKRKFIEQGAMPEMLALLERCLEDEPGDRPADAYALAEDLVPLITGALPGPPGGSRPDVTVGDRALSSPPGEQWY